VSTIPVVYERPLFGRSTELALLAGVFDRVDGGAGQAALIEGEAGIGKSRLLAEVLAGADGTFTVLRGEADEFDRGRPFGVLAEAMELRPGVADPDRAEIGRHLTVGDERSGPGGSQTLDLGFRIVDGILSLLERLTDRGPVVLALDDLQWADPSTLQALRSIGRRLGQLPLALLITCRPSPRSAGLHRVVDSLVAQGGLRVALGGLDDQAVSEIAADLAGGRPGPGLLAQVDRALGNPLFVGELIGSLRDEGVLDLVDGRAEVAEGTLPPTLQLTILRRLNLLSEPTLDLLRLASILGRSFSVTHLSVVLRRSALELLPALDEAVAAGVLGGTGDQLAFRHDLIREAVYEDLPLAVRRGLHRDAGRALADFGAPASEVATQLALGASSGDTEAVGWLRRAAGEAALRSPAVAVELLERALALLPEGSPERLAVVADTAPLLIQLGRGAEVVALARQSLTRGPAPDVDIALRRALGEVLWAGGRLALAASELEAAANVAQAPAAERAGALALAANARFFLGDLARARTEAEQAEAEGLHVGDHLSICLALQTLALVADAEGSVAEAVQLAERAVALAEQLSHPRVGYLYPHLYLGLLLLDADRFDEATASLQEGRRLAEQRGSTVWLPLYHFALGMVGYLAGGWDDAVAESEAGLALGDEIGTRLHAPFLRGMTALVAISRGDLVAAEERIAVAGAEFIALADDDWLAAVAEGGLVAAGPQWPVEYGEWIQGLLLEARGDLAGAAVSLGQAWVLAAPLRHFLSARLFGPDLVRVALRVGDRERALAVTEELEEAALRSKVATAEGAALLCRGLFEDDVEDLVAAVGAYRRGPRPLGTAMAAEEAGKALARAGRAPEAVSLLEEARALYEDLRAQTALARTEAALRALGVRHRRAAGPRRATLGWESLTDTEAAVVRLVAEGLTNRQVGERLFVSRRTVETHLGHVFQKLGLSTRVQLAAQAARRVG